MNPHPEDTFAAPPPPPRPKMGLAITCLVLGILAIILSFALIGSLLGLVGAALGLVHILNKRGPTVMAWVGTGLSVLGILASITFGIAYFRYLPRALNVGTQLPEESALTKWEGVAAPDFSITCLNGKVIKLSDLKGKRVVINFWATWCGWCSREIPHLNKLYADTSRDDLEIIAITDEDKAEVDAFVAKNGMKYPIGLAAGMPSPYKDIRGRPTTFFIDRQGSIHSIVLGYNDFDSLQSQISATN